MSSTPEPHDNQIETFDRLLHQLMFTLRFDQPGQLSEKLAGLQGIELHLMQLIARNPNLILKEIRRILGMPNSTLTSMIDRLEQRGLLRRVISKRDRRSFQLELTPSGWEVQTEHDRQDRLVAARILGALGDDTERTTLLHLIEKILVHLDKEG